MHNTDYAFLIIRIIFQYMEKVRCIWLTEIDPEAITGIIDMIRVGK